MASHGDKENLLRMTIMNRNYEEVIRQHLYKNNYLEALEVLKSQGNKELFYQFTGILLQELPKPTIAALISQGSYLMPSKLLPALVSSDQDEKHVSCETYIMTSLLVRFAVIFRSLQSKKKITEV